MTALTRVRAALAAGERPSDDDVREVCGAATELLAALKALADAPCSYAGSHIHIFCDSHSDAMLRMRNARIAIDAALREPK